MRRLLTSAVAMATAALLLLLLAAPPSAATVNNSFMVSGGTLNINLVPPLALDLSPCGPAPCGAGPVGDIYLDVTGPNGGPWATAVTLAALGPMAFTYSGATYFL